MGKRIIATTIIRLSNLTVDNIGSEPSDQTVGTTMLDRIGCSGFINLRRYFGPADQV